MQSQFVPSILENLEVVRACVRVCMCVAQHSSDLAESVVRTILEQSSV